MNPSSSQFFVMSGKGWNVETDGDLGLHSGAGFYHQELTTAGNGIRPTQTDALALPAGAACGFHHTQVSPANTQTGIGTCMGYDAAKSCPTGWSQKFVFDDGSGNGQLDCALPTSLDAPADCGYWVWCEYNDPNKFGESTASLQNAATLGIAMNVSSVTTDIFAVDGVSAAGQACPAGWARTANFDDVRPSGQGLSACIPPAGPATTYNFSASDARGDTSQGDWSPGYFKSECAVSQQATGLSMTPGGSAHDLQCGAGTGTIPAFGKNACHDVVFASSTNRGTTSTGTWDPGGVMGECGTNEYVAGVSQSTSGSVESILCCADSGVSHLSCEAEVFAASDARETSADGDWDSGHFKGECGPSRYVAGVSHDSSGHPRAILCCGDQ